jgi:hypothetical protein
MSGNTFESPTGDGGSGTPSSSDASVVVDGDVHFVDVDVTYENFGTTVRHTDQCGRTEVDNVASGPSAIKIVGRVQLSAANRLITIKESGETVRVTTALRTTDMFLRDLQATQSSKYNDLQIDGTKEPAVEVTAQFKADSANPPSQ